MTSEPRSEDIEGVRSVDIWRRLNIIRRNVPGIFEERQRNQLGLGRVSESKSKR